MVPKLNVWVTSGMVRMGSLLSGKMALLIMRGLVGRFSLYSPLLNCFCASVLINVLKPSSIQGYLRSLEPTIMGNQLWPNSWEVTPHKPPFFEPAEQNT